MRAVTYQGARNVMVKEVDAPTLHNDNDIVIKVTSTAICGSDLHLIHGRWPEMPEGFIIGHEPMGIVEEVGKDVKRLKKGDRVVASAIVSCGHCWYCQHDLESQCDNSNPKGEIGGILGYSNLLGGFPGGQAEYLRVPYADHSAFRVPDDCELDDEKLLFLSDIVPTSFWSVDNGGVKPGDTVVVLGCGPVGLLTQKFAWLKGAERVIAVDYIDYRLEHAKRTNQVEALDFTQFDNVGEHIKEITGGGADVVIDCVGMDGKMTVLEQAETFLKLQGGAMGAIIISTQAVRKGGTIQLTGVYGTRYNAFPLGDMFARNVTLKMGQVPANHYVPHLYQMIVDGRIDPTDVITHRLPLSEAKHAYSIFDQKQDNCIKVVLKPGH